MASAEYATGHNSTANNAFLTVVCISLLRRAAERLIEPGGHPVLVALEFRVFFPVDDAVNTVLHGNQLARNTSFLEQLVGEGRLFIGHSRIRRALNEQEGRSLVAKVGCR